MFYRRVDLDYPHELCFHPKHPGYINILISKLYGFVMENITINMVNAAKATLRQSNESGFLNQGYLVRVKVQENILSLTVTIFFYLFKIIQRCVVPFQ